MSNKTYNLNSYTCADFGIDIGNLGGMNLPKTTVKGSFGMFSGRAPGKLGQQIRKMKSNSTIKISTSKRTSPANTKEKC